MSAPSTSGLSVELLLRVIDVKYGCFTLLYFTLLWHEFLHVLQTGKLFSCKFSTVLRVKIVNKNCFKISLTSIHLIRSINDPEHPLTLEQLNVVEQSLVEVDDDKGYVKVHFTPTIPHCSMATLIGLAIRVQLLRSLPDRFKVLFRILCSL